MIWLHCYMILHIFNIRTIRIISLLLYARYIENKGLLANQRTKIFEQDSETNIRN